MPPGHWRDPKNQLEFMERMKEENRFTQLSDFYKLTSRDIAENGIYRIFVLTRLGGYALLSQFNNSLPKLLSSVYPEYSWKFWLFQQVPGQVWQDKKNQREYMDSLAAQLGFKTTEDWYNITKADIKYFILPLSTKTRLEKMEERVSFHSMRIP